MNLPKAIKPLIALSLASAAPSSAAVVSWNLDNNGTLTTSAVAGVVPVANWSNSFPSNPVTNLVDDTGATTTLDISTASFNTFRIQGSQPAVDGDGTYNKKLLNGYLNSGNAQSPASSSVAISQIPYAQYNIIVYFSSDVAGRAGTVTDGTTTYDFATLGPASISGSNAVLTQTTSTGGTNPGANYAIFSGLTGASQTVSANIPAFGGIAGFQVVAVPEPSAALLGGLGLFGLLRRRRA